MIKNRLKILLAERDLNYSKLSEMTGISINALSKMGKEGGTGSKQLLMKLLIKFAGHSTARLEIYWCGFLKVKDK